MRRFLAKFIGASLLALLPAAYFSFIVVPNVSGEIGYLGMIPFGKEYEGLSVPGYERSGIDKADVIEVQSRDSLKYYSFITIGDSFSQFHENGYQWKLSSLSNTQIANFKNNYGFDSVNGYIALIDGEYLSSGQTVILERVERAIVYNFANAQFKVQEPEENEEPSSSNKEPFLNRYLSWIRLLCNIRDPIQRFNLNKACFTHPVYSDKIFIYNSKTIKDGDILWRLNTEEDYAEMNKNIDELFELSEAKGINLILLIAADKYDTYSPWISDAHETNPTLSRIADNERIYISKDCLQKAISDDVMDVYKLNNTHWSVVGADIVASSLYEWMKTKNLLPPMR